MLYVWIRLQAEGRTGLCVLIRPNGEILRGECKSMRHVVVCEEWRRVKEAVLVAKESVRAVVKRREREKRGQCQNSYVIN